MDFSDSTTQYTAGLSLLALTAGFLLFHPTGFVKWLQKKNYQYEVTFSLYMLTPTEKFVFSTFHYPSQSTQLVYARNSHCKAPPILLISLTFPFSLSHRFHPLPNLLSPPHRQRHLPPESHHDHVATNILLLRWRRRSHGDFTNTIWHGHARRRCRVRVGANGVSDGF